MENKKLPNYFIRPTIMGSGIKMIVASSYNDLPSKVKLEIPESEFQYRWKNKNELPILPIKSAMGPNYVAFITGPEKYQEIKEKYYHGKYTNRYL